MRPFETALVRRVPVARTPVAALSATGVVVGAVSVAQAVCLAWLASTVVRGGELAAPLAWTVGLLLARAVLAGAQESVAGWAGHRVASAVRLQVLRRWARLPEGSRPAPDVAVTRATEGIAAVEPYVARYLPALVAGAVVPALTVLTLLVVDPWSALIVVLTVPLLPLFAALIGRHTRDETQRRWAAMTDLAGHFLDVVRGLPTLVAYGRAERQVEVVAEVGRRHRTATVRTLRTAFMSTVALELLATISVALVAVAVGLRLAYGAMDLQVGMTAILLAPEAYWPIRRVGAEFHNAADGAEALAALRDDLADPGGGSGAAGAGDPSLSRAADPSVSGTADLSAGQVRVRGVRYHHPGRADTLRDLTLSSDPGPGLTALTGPSGVGKTTLLELIAGLRVPDAGEVTAPPAHLATQRPLLLPGTVRDNLRLACPDATDGEMTLALERVGLAEALAAREGLQTVLGDDGFGLSAGQRTRVALARALLSGAPLLLLDEPTAHVAQDSVALLRGIVADLARHHRVVVATHDPGMVALADQHWVLAGVPADASGRPQERHPARPVGSDEATPRVRSEGSDATRRVRSEGAEASLFARLDPGPGWFARHVAPRWRLRSAAALGGLSIAAGVALTATSGWLIVQASYQPVVLTLMVAIVGVRAFGIARPVLRYAERVVSHDVALADLARERTRVYEQLVPLTPARLGRRSRGDVLTAVVRDLDDVVDEQVRVYVPAVGTAVAGAVASVIVGAFVPAAGMVLAAGTLAAFALGRWGQAREQSAHADLVLARAGVRRSTGAVTAQLTALQAVTGIGTGAAAVLDRLALDQDLADRASRRLSSARGLVLAATWLVVAVAAGVVAVLAGAAYSAGTLSGPVAALVTLTPMALAESWTSLPDVFGARARAEAARTRLTAVLSQTPAVTDHAEGQWPAGMPARPTLTTEQVQARWSPVPPDRPEPDLPPTSLDLLPGERLLLTGANGAGKSTLLAVLARHLDPSGGSYRHDGHDVLALDLHRTRDRLAVVDDEPHAFAGSVRANLVLARPEAIDEEMVAALHEADLGGWLSGQPDGLDTRLSGLSGGERTRLALARAVLSRRPVLLLDEPTAHLDEVTARTVLERVVGGHPDTTVVMVSHSGSGAPGAGWDRLEIGRGTREVADGVHSA